MAGAGFWEVAFSACALLLIAEGVLPFMSPGAWRRAFAKAMAMSDGQLRFLGLVSMLSGLAMLFVFWS